MAPVPQYHAAHKMTPSPPRAVTVPPSGVAKIQSNHRAGPMAYVSNSLRETSVCRKENLFDRKLISALLFCVPSPLNSTCREAVFYSDLSDTFSGDAKVQTNRLVCLSWVAKSTHDFNVSYLFRTLSHINPLLYAPIVLHNLSVDVALRNAYK